MKPSTLVELVGFGCLIAAASMFGVVAGLVAAGVSCLFIGYATDDEVTGLSVVRMLEPVRRRRAALSARRAERKADRKANRKAPKPA